MRRPLLAAAILFGLAGPAFAVEDAVSTGLTASYTAEAKGDYAGALSAIASLKADGDVGYTLVLRRGWLQYASGAYPDAVASYQAAIAAKPTSIEAKLGLTLPLMALKRWTEVRATCAEILAQLPGQSTATSRLAWAQYNLGKYSESAATYASLVAAYPSDVDLRAGLGWAQLKLGQTAEARASFLIVLKLAPANESAKAGLAAAGG